MHTMLTKRQRLIADQLWDCGAIKIDTVNGFPIKAQEEDPTIPNSPVYMNIRTNRHPKNPGPVTDETMSLMGDEIGDVLDELDWPFTLYADIPDAGTPFGDQVARLLAERGRNAGGRIAMQKVWLPNGKRMISQEIVCDREVQVGEGTALFDDLVTKMHTKLEAARGLEANGLNVRLILPFFDRGQGGIQGLRMRGYYARSIMSLLDMLAYYSQGTKTRIHSGEYATIRDYLRS